MNLDEARTWAMLMLDEHGLIERGWTVTGTTPVGAPASVASARGRSASADSSQSTYRSESSWTRSRMR